MYPVFVTYQVCGPSLGSGGNCSFSRPAKGPPWKKKFEPGDSLIGGHLTP